MLLLLLNGGSGGGPVYARAPAGGGYVRTTLTVSRPASSAVGRPAQPNTKRP